MVITDESLKFNIYPDKEGAQLNIDKQSILCGICIKNKTLWLLLRIFFNWITFGVCLCLKVFEATQRCGFPGVVTITRVLVPFPSVNWLSSKNKNVCMHNNVIFKSRCNFVKRRAITKFPKKTWEKVRIKLWEKRKLHSVQTFKVWKTIVI